MFGEHNILFDIKVIEPTVPENTLSIIVGLLSCLLILILVSGVVYWKIKKKRENEMKHSK